MTDNNNQPLVSVVIPVYNGGEIIGDCLKAIKNSSFNSFEIIVVDDCSSDDTVLKAKRYGVKVIRTKIQIGPGGARNLGVKNASGEIILFIDSDILVASDTIERVVEDFNTYKDLAALFGSYDDRPTEKNFISQYRNLFHHYHHQASNREATTFWAGCGAVKKDVFEEMRGFDCSRFSKPSIEDIELGYRMTHKGLRIILDKDIQVKHVKRWDIYSMVRTDVLQRAIPWSILIMETGYMPNDLNLTLSHKISSLSVALLMLISPLVLTKYISSIVIIILLLLIIALNRKLYGFYLAKRGFLFMLGVIPMHILYYFYSGASYITAWTIYKLGLRLSLKENKI